MLFLLWYGEYMVENEWCHCNHLEIWPYEHFSKKFLSKSKHFCSKSTFLFKWGHFIQNIWTKSGFRFSNYFHFEKYYQNAKVTNWQVFLQTQPMTSSRTKTVRMCLQPVLVWCPREDIKTVSQCPFDGQKRDVAKDIKMSDDVTVGQFRKMSQLARTPG